MAVPHFAHLKSMAPSFDVHSSVYGDRHFGQLVIVDVAPMKLTSECETIIATGCAQTAATH